MSVHVHVGGIIRVYCWRKFGENVTWMHEEFKQSLHGAEGLERSVSVRSRNNLEAFGFVITIFTLLWGLK